MGDFVETRHGSASRAAALTNTATRCLLGTAAAALMISFGPATVRAETSSAELAAEIKELRAQIREMKSAISETRVETRRTQARVKAVAARTPAPGYAVPYGAPAQVLPVGATPVFVTADKKFQFGAITITPGGFIAAESVFRTRATQSDINTGYGSIPFGNSSLGHTNEFRFTARQSRVALLAEGAITPTFVAAAYLELDFLGAANTGNSNESNSYNPRVRNLYATLDNADYGMHVLAGQNWSLATLNSKGITPRNEVTPPSIDGQFVPGFVWARQPGIRLTKDFNQKLWLSISAEESQTTFATACPAGTNAPGTFGINGNFNNGNVINGINCSALGTGGGFGGDTNNFSLNHVPDVIGKVAYEARFADRDIHTEVFGMYRDFYDRVSYTLPTTGIGENQNRDTTGYGIGAGLIVPVIPRRLDFQASGLYGRGIGRYGTSQLADTTFNSDGSLRPIREFTGLVGLTFHATPAIDVYAFSGIEKAFRTYSYSGNNATPFYGYGAPTAIADTSAGCGLEANQIASAQGGAAYNPCAGATRAVFQITGGFWDKVYKGSFGEVRAGVQYQFTERQIFNTAVGYPGTGAAVTPANSYAPKAYDHAVLTSLRYYPFQ